MIRRVVCRVWGHRDVAARPLPPMMLPTVGLLLGWERCEPEESRGIGCDRCGRYDSHAWVIEALRRGLPIESPADRPGV